MAADEFAESFDLMARANTPEELLEGLLRDQFVGMLANLPVEPKRVLRASYISASEPNLQASSRLLSDILEWSKRELPPEEQWSSALLRADLAAFQMLLGDFKALSAGVIQALEIAGSTGKPGVVTTTLAGTWPLVWYRLRKHPFDNMGDTSYSTIIDVIAKKLAGQPTEGVMQLACFAFGIFAGLPLWAASAEPEPDWTPRFLHSPKFLQEATRWADQINGALPWGFPQLIRDFASTEA